VNISHQKFEAEPSIRPFARAQAGKEFVVANQHPRAAGQQ